MTILLAFDHLRSGILTTSCRPSLTLTSTNCSVREQALDNRQMHLDVMCFPGLFPTGYFGEFHPREKKISRSEFIKSRLYNKESRFRKEPQYVFYLLWLKELREALVWHLQHAKNDKKPSYVSRLPTKQGTVV